MSKWMCKQLAVAVSCLCCFYGKPARFKRFPHWWLSLARGWSLKGKENKHVPLPCSYVRASWIIRKLLSPSGSIAQLPMYKSIHLVSVILSTLLLILLSILDCVYIFASKTSHNQTSSSDLGGLLLHQNTTAKSLRAEFESGCGLFHVFLPKCHLLRVKGKRQPNKPDMVQQMNRGRKLRLWGVFLRGDTMG